MTETLGLYGERIDAEGRAYYAPSSPDTRWRDGRAIDAGTAHVLANDLAHYSAESLRHLVCSATPGGFDTNPGKGLADAWSTSTVLGIAIPTDIATESPAEIPWNQLCSMRFLLPHSVRDRPRKARGLALRRVRVSIDCECELEDGVRLFVALTSGRARPLEGPLLAFRYTGDAGLVAGADNVDEDYAALAVLASGRQTVHVVLEPNAIDYPRQWVYTRESNASGRQVSQAISTTLWIGWTLSSSSNFAIYSVSAYEWPNPATESL